MARSAEALKSEWLAALSRAPHESAHVARLCDDATRFLAFAQEHLGRTLDEKTLARLKPTDFRAFITRRRDQGLGARRAPRHVGAASFFRHLSREQIVDNPAPHAVRTPKLARTLPRPLSERTRRATLEEAGSGDVAWIAARDAALLSSSMARACGFPKLWRCAAAMRLWRLADGSRQTQQERAMPFCR